ncbi:MAG: DUF2155 domain-containing protein [Rhodospirillaceae bacterium]|nr:DUF2155 domain-containing protein [Rhodospirillaceae bacterium]
MIFWRAPVALVFMAVYAVFWTPRADAQSVKTAVLQGLDKVTARISTIQVPIGEGVKFGTLVVTARTCSKRPPEDTPETTAFLEIVDDKPGELPRLVFSGWMFASSPALSAMEHAVYDVWVIDCKIAAGSGESGNE